MKQIIFGIKDELVGFVGISTNKTEAEAVRGFDLAVNSKQETLFTQHTKDFSLWKLGEYDSETGVIVPELKLIIDASSLKRKEN